MLEIEQEISRKKVYESPRLLVMGDIRTMTQTNNNAALQDALGLPPPVVGSNF